MPLSERDIKWDEPSKSEAAVVSNIKWDNMGDKNYVEQQVAQLPSLQAHVTAGLASGESYTQIRARLKDFETERTAETAPWIDPAIAFSGGFGAAGKIALSRGATPIGAAIKAALGGTTAAATEPISGGLTEKVAEKYPRAALPFNLVTSGLLGAGVEAPFERVISRAAGRVLPKTAAKIAPSIKAPKEADIKWDVRPQEKTLYHGTKEAFSFEEAKLSEPRHHLGPGFYTSENPKIASYYARGEGGNVKEIKFNPKKTFDFDDVTNKIEIEKLAKKLTNNDPEVYREVSTQIAEETGLSLENLKTNRDSYRFLEGFAGREHINKALRNLKYDSIKAGHEWNLLKKPPLAAVVSGTLPKIDVEAGYAEIGPVTRLMKKAAKSFKEFWQPLSTVPESGKLLKLRAKSLGNLHRVEDFTKKIWKRTNKLESEVKRDMFRYLDGEMDINALPLPVQGLAKSLRNTMNMTGKMLVRRGLLTEETFQANKNQYTRYIYLKHVLGDKHPIKIGQGGAMNLSNLKKRKDLTKEQQRAIGLVEDVSVSAPVGLMQTLTNIAKYDFFKKILQNINWTWQPSIVKIKLPGELRAKSMGIGKLAEEVKIMREVYEQAPNVPEIKAKFDALSGALDRAMIETQNVPEGFVQLPTSEAYGPLAGAFVRKPIAQDIMPVYSMKNTGLSKIVDTIFNILKKGLAVFKVTKVALNPPTAFRNVISNTFQLNMSGIPLPMIPVHMTKAMEHMLAKSPEFIQAKRNGLFRTNWAQVEIKDVLDTIRPLQNKPHQQVLSGLAKVAEQYGKIDDFFKMAKFLEQRGRGVPVPEAVGQAMKWGMDYSLVHPSIKVARNFLIPFISYQYKIAPLIAESLAKRPWVIGKYLAIPYMMAKMIKDRDEITEKQWQKLEKDLPLYIKKEKSYMIVPWKSPEGTYQWVNLEYYFPWGNLMSMGRAMYDKDAREALEGLGIGNPFLDIYAAFKGMRGDLPPKDPFTGREIYNELDRPSGKAAKTMEWLYNKWAPSFATRYGALGYASRIGRKDRYGRTTTPGHAVGRVFGFNVVAPTPEQSVKAKKARVLELRFALSRVMKDPTISAEEKNRARQAFTRKMNEVME